MAKPNTREDIFTQKVKNTRPPIQPVTSAMSRSSTSNKAPEKILDPRLARLQIVSVDRITASHYQHRDELNAAEDKDYQTLRQQIQTDMEAQPNVEMRTIENVFFVMPDPKNEEMLILAKGGHRRFQICLDLGVKEICVWIKDYDEAALAGGTYQENKGRKKTSWIEDARAFQAMKKTLGWSQTEIAQRLHVEGGQPHVSRVLAMLDYHEDLQRLLALSEDGGMRVANELARLEKRFGIEKARELWNPLIAGFLNGSLVTEDVVVKVREYLGEKKEPPHTSLADFPALRYRRLAHSVQQKWHSLVREIGDQPLDDETRAEVEKVYNEMGKMLGVESPNLENGAESPDR